MMTMAAAGHETAIQWLSENWIWVLIWCWVLGIFGWMGDTWRRIVRRREQAAALRHQRAVEIELARRGIPYRRAAAAVSLPRDDDEDEAALPAAVIPSPPSARPVRGVPGACRHERIIPVIAADGELKRWICANYPRCEAEFGKDIAIYEPADGPS
jgi:hypothetical protein